MGFQSADLVPFAKHLTHMRGVSGVWVLPWHEDHGATLWVAVTGFDERAHSWRNRVYEALGEYVDENKRAMRDSAFVFDYHVVIDEAELGPLQIPSSATRIAA